MPERDLGACGGRIARTQQALQHGDGEPDELLDVARTRRLSRLGRPRERRPASGAQTLLVSLALKLWRIVDPTRRRRVDAPVALLHDMPGLVRQQIFTAGTQVDLVVAGVRERVQRSRRRRVVVDRDIAQVVAREPAIPRRKAAGRGAGRPAVERRARARATAALPTVCCSASTRSTSASSKFEAFRGAGVTARDSCPLSLRLARTPPRVSGTRAGRGETFRRTRFRRWITDLARVHTRTGAAEGLRGSRAWSCVSPASTPRSWPVSRGSLRSRSGCRSPISSRMC